MKRVLAMLLCLVLAVMIFPASAMADSSKELIMPQDKEYLETPFQARVETGYPNGKIYVLPRPESGYGNLGLIDCGTEVTILAERGSYFFFEMQDGSQGWNKKQFFAYYKDENGDYALPDFQMISTKGARLVFPKESQYFAEPFTREVKSCGRIYLMPKPEDGHGDLGLVEDGEQVTILAELYGFYFFKTEDGRCGWNGTVFFK